MIAKSQEADEDDIIALAQTMSVAALKRLEQIVLYGGESAAVIAAEAILDCAFGSPRQTVVHMRSGVVFLPEKESNELRKEHTNG